MSAISIDYGVTADGRLAARVGDMGYIAIPVRGGFRLASGWRLSRPISDWNDNDVYGSEGVVADEAAFRAHVDAVAVHLRQRDALGRKEARVRVSTPWGHVAGRDHLCRWRHLPQHSLAWWVQARPFTQRRPASGAADQGWVV